MAEPQSNRQSNSIVIILAGVVMLLLAVVAWLVLSPKDAGIDSRGVEPEVIVSPAAPPVVVPAPVEPEAAQAVEEVPDTPQEETVVEAQPQAPSLPPLPLLNESDPSVMALADELDPLQQLSALLIPDRVLLKFVRAVIALDEGNVVKDYRPLQSPAPPMKVIAIDEPLNIEIGQRYRIDPQNYQRYNKYVDALASVDKAHLARLYHHYYPLLDEAYQQYGVDRGGFLNVTLRAIDAVNAVKIDDYNAVLIQPKVFYDFQDPQLQAKSGPYKLLFRIGPDNSAKVQSALKALRDELVKPQ